MGRSTGRTVTALAVVAMAAAGACVTGGGERAGGTTTTTVGGQQSTTSTTTEGTSGGGGSGGGGGGASGSGSCDGEPPIWALKEVRSPDGPEGAGGAGGVGVDDPDDSSGGSGRGGSGGSTGSDDDPGGSTGSGGGSTGSGGSGGSEECEPVQEPELGTGDVQITLRWESDADLDLHVTEPSGEEIWYSDRGPTSTGGQLDVDSNVGCDNDGSVENIFWPEGDMPLGDYTVKVVGFSVDGCGGGDYTLTVKVEGEEILNESGSVEEDEEDVYEFST